MGSVRLFWTDIGVLELDHENQAGDLRDAQKPNGSSSVNSQLRALTLTEYKGFFCTVPIAAHLIIESFPAEFGSVFPVVPVLTKIIPHI